MPRPRFASLSANGQRRARRAGLALAAVALVLGGYWFARGAVLIDPTPCPSGVTALKPTSVRLQPAVVEHQSWVTVPTSKLANGDWIAVCVDGMLLSGENVTRRTDLSGTVYRVGVRTRWVLWTWVTGCLMCVEDPERWSVVWLARPRSQAALANT